MSTVHVSNISHQTSEKEVGDFFSFCGKISSITVTPASSDPNSPLSATVTFERESASKTALLLDNTQLGANTIKVESTASIEELTSSKDYEHDPEKGDFDQEVKPKSAVLAEYLSHGYIIGDNVLQKALDLDEKHGITTKFSNVLTSIDLKLHATDKAKAINTTYGVSDKATNTYAQGSNMLSRYFESAIETPTGQRIRSFYNTGSKQVLDIHNEALRLKELRQPTTTKPANCTCGGVEGKCGCPAGECTCAGCAKPGPHNTESEKTLGTTTGAGPAAPAV